MNTQFPSVSDNLFNKGPSNYCFLVSSTDKKKKKRGQIKEQNKEEEEKYILCNHCEYRITLPEYQIEVQGEFNHTFLNPAGRIYNIGCFKKAEGCLVLGELTSEWSWFHGFEWQVATCSQCFKHLGWFYSSKTEQTFFGLILDALI